MSQKYTLARLTISGERFEVMVNPEHALDYKMGKPVGLSQILIQEAIYKDVGKGERASEEKMKQIFKTLDASKIAKDILDRGELQLTTDQRRKLSEDKRKQIINFVSRHCIDPRTNLPHPPLRVEQAMGQIRVSIDPFKDAEEQAKEVIQSLKPILPIKMEMAVVEVKIPPQFASKAYGTVKAFGSIVNEQWQADGSLAVSVEMPAGLQGPFLEKLGNITKGSAQSRKVK